jgi:2-polyprenyl-3-methyl-5-hydroxy-6-metoxy-1,4-benzoquinol methylase
VDPPPPAAELARLYDDPAYFRDGDTGYDDYLGAEASHRRLAAGRLRRIGRYQAAGRLLDLGSAAGFFLAEAQRRGWEVAGIEMSTHMRARAEDIAPGRVFSGWSEARHALSRLDLVTMWEYIEHCPAPLDELREAAALIRPGGLLALSTPNTEHRLAQDTPRKWREYKPPAHVGFFTARSLAQALTRTGFDVVEVAHTAPLTAFDTAGFWCLRGLGASLGSGSDRRTPLWWVTSLGHRVYTLPARCRALIAPARHCVGLEMYARRR